MARTAGFRCAHGGGHVITNGEAFGASHAAPPPSLLDLARAAAANPPRYAPPRDNPQAAPPPPDLGAAIRAARQRESETRAAKRPGARR